AAGAPEDLSFRGVGRFGFVAAGQRRPHVGMGAALVSFLFFRPAHLLYLLAGDQLLRVLALNLWAFLLGPWVSLVVRTAGCVWPAAVLHGGVDAIVHMTRRGHSIVPPPGKASLMVLAAVPVVLYALACARRSAAWVGSVPSRLSSDPDEATHQR